MSSVAAAAARYAAGDGAGDAGCAGASTGWWEHDAGDVPAGWLSGQAHADHGQRPTHDGPNPAGSATQSAIHNPSAGAPQPWVLA
jgi:hypothetical protein